nr:Rv3654c family TadE-like protein [Mycobacterium sp.]
MVAAWMVVVLLWATGIAAYLGSAVVARHRAQAAADLAALAAAARLASGSDAACSRAAVVAREMRVNDIRCVVDGLDVVITAGVAVVVAGTARASARAGPAVGAGD